MPPQKQVSRLQKIAVTSIVDRVYPKLSEINEDEAAGLARDLCNLVLVNNPNAYDDLLHLLLPKLADDYGIDKKSKLKVQKFLPKLLGGQLKELDFPSLCVSFDKVVMKIVYDLMDTCCTGLTKLIIGQSFYFQPELISDLGSKLIKFSKLTELKLLYVGTTAMLVNLGTSCPRLVHLSLKGSSGVDDEAVPYIIGCRNLLSLDIQGTKISGDGRLEIIENSSRIETIDHCPYNCGSDFRIFKSRREIFDLIREGYNRPDSDEEEQMVKPDKNFRLKNFWLSNPKSDELICAVVFPFLETLRLDFIFQDLEHEIDPTPLSRLKSLKTLDLNFYDSARNDLFRGIIEACGHNLTSLIYNVFSEYSNVVECHNIIGGQCPNLTSLAFLGDFEYFQTRDAETDALLIPRDSQPDPGFHSKLLNLRLGGHCTNRRLSWLLASAPNIKKIELDGDLEAITTTAWTNMLADNGLTELESVWFNTSTSIGLEAIRSLVDSCPKLNKIGRLVNLYENLADRRLHLYHELAGRARAENMDLDLVWVSANKAPKNTTTKSPVMVPMRFHAVTARLA